MDQLSLAIDHYIKLSIRTKCLIKTTTYIDNDEFETEEFVIYNTLFEFKGDYFEMAIPNFNCFEINLSRDETYTYLTYLTRFMKETYEIDLPSIILDKKQPGLIAINITDGCISIIHQNYR